MAWQSLVIEVAGDTSDRISDALMESGALAVTIEDASAGTVNEQPRYGEPAFDQTGNPWRNSRVSALFDADVDVDRALTLAAAACKLPATIARNVEIIEDKDWVRHTQAQFDPIHISDRIWIVPSWHDDPDPHAINIKLDPGLAFGTGGHPTTQLCVAWLEQRMSAGASVIDYGCGSGILAIAAAKLGAGRVLGVDIDPVAVSTARENALANKVACEFVDCSTTIPDRADLVLANILANPLKILAPVLASLTCTGGRLVLSGLLTEQIEAVSECYAPYFDMATFDIREDWAALEGIRR
ncbi:MAG: 50S ribosomal protein L11 methyltransferase [Burkholderiales bacterium]